MPKKSETVKAKHNRTYERRMKLAAHAALGGKCVVCGWEDHRALQIDHVSGGGNVERKQLKLNTTRFYRHVVANAHTGQYQLLCANHNWVKRFEQDEVRGL